MLQNEATGEIGDFPHGRVPRAIRESQILALAEELFAERGYRDASMNELARRAGVSKPVIYDLVGSKDELFRRCFERAAGELAESVAAEAEAGDLETVLRSTALAFFRFIDDHRRAWAVLFYWDSGGRAAAHVGEIRARQAELTVSLLSERARQAGITLDRTRAEAAAYALNGAFEALAHWWRDHPEVEAERLADWLVELTLPGLRDLIA